MYISLDSYRVFYHVAQQRSFTKAAHALYSNQPNVTRTIKNLEQALGCMLFVRSSRSVCLTPEGERLYAHIKIAMEQITIGETEIMRLKNLESGSLSIGVSEVALRCFLLPVLKEYRNQYPQVRLKVSNHSTPQAIAALQAGSVDIAFVTMPTEQLHHVEIKPLGEYHEAAVAGPAFSELEGKNLTLAEIAEYPIVSLGKETQSYVSYDGWFGDHGLEFMPDVEAATADQILPLVRNNLGIGFIPEAFLQDREAADVYRLKLTQPIPKRVICCAHQKGKPLSVAATALENMLEDFAGKIQESV